MSSRVVVTIGFIVALALVMGYEALAAPTLASQSNVTITQLEKRVAKLEYRLSLQAKINVLQSRINRTQISQDENFSREILDLQSRGSTLQTSVQFSFGTGDSQGGASSIAFCPGGQKVVGGGGGFVGQSYYDDHLIYSHAVPGSEAWAASGDSPVGGRGFEVYAVCAVVG